MKYKRKKNYWQQEIHNYAYVLALLQGGGILCIISYLFYGNLYWALLFSPYLIWHIKSWEKQTIKKKKEQFRLQFKEAIQSIAAALNVGYSVENALKETVKDLSGLYKKDDVILKECSYMIRQLQMNVPIETAMKEFAERTGEEDVDTFVTVFCMAKRSGGDTMEMIRNVVRQMGDKIDVEREIETILTAKKLEFRILTWVPLGMVAYLKLSFPELTRILYGNGVGVVVMSICLIIYVAAYELGRRMVEIEV